MRRIKRSPESAAVYPHALFEVKNGRRVKFSDREAEQVCRVSAVEK